VLAYAKGSRLTCSDGMGYRATDCQIGERCATSAFGRVESVDLDASVSGEDTGVAIGLVQFYAGTRPTPAIEAHENRTPNALVQQRRNAVRCNR